MRYSKSRNASTGCLNLTLGTRNIIWAFLFHFSFVSSASWLVLRGVMSARCQAVITLSRIVFSCNGWLRCAILISCIRIIHLHEFFFISWAGSRMRDDCYVGHTHCSLEDKLESIVCSMFTVPNVFGAWQHLRSSKLMKPVLVLNVDGTRNQEGDITHYVLLTVGIGKHAEKLWCAVTCLGKVPLILGHDWLKKHNPDIDWTTSDVKLSCCPLSASHSWTCALLSWFRTMNLRKHGYRQ